MKDKGLKRMDRHPHDGFVPKSGHCEKYTWGGSVVDLAKGELEYGDDLLAIDEGCVGEACFPLVKKETRGRHHVQHGAQDSSPTPCVEHRLPQIPQNTLATQTNIGPAPLWHVTRPRPCQGNPTHNLKAQWVRPWQQSLVTENSAGDFKTFRRVPHYRFRGRNLLKKKGLM
ncbi:hypothetical protein GIB67_032878 [Kingdonia uniflora]|uniref:Uncharacterized protein n=1 Tax=Kingdonia uniflora TaxID=39325 RepID=A0A7J7NCB5_9MAGN|nr:hypothetical protein GIB67_032878 [Kingdonia uniflora]